MTQILKPCPWCRNEGVEITHPNGCHSYWVVCLDDDCQAEGPCRDTEAAAIAAWNARHSDPDELREALVEITDEFCEYHCGTGISGPPHEPECVKARTALSRNVGDGG